MALHPPPAPSAGLPATPRRAQHRSRRAGRVWGQHRASRAGRRSQVMVLVVAVLGVGMLVYPSAASWFSARAHDADVTGYVQHVERLPLPEKEAELLRAREYNTTLPGAPLGDPYAAGAGMDPIATGVADYLDQLDETSVMARVRIPAMDVDLPVYHGTATQTLARGVGHLFGSSLPVGGPGTHAVLTGHSGLVQAKVFDALHDVTIGDTFTISVLDQVLTYRVDQILTVEPSNTDDLQIVPGHDYVTLVTCTPIGVNSHRLLVRGERITTPETIQAGPVTVPGTGRTAGFPWWSLGLLTVPAAFAVGMRTRRRTAASTTRRTPPRDTARRETPRRDTRRRPTRTGAGGARHARQH